MIYRLKKFQSIYQHFFDRYDVLLSPVLSAPPPLIGDLSPKLDFEELFNRIQNYATFTPIHNIAGAPAISLPIGQTQGTGLPIGMQFSAAIGDEKHYWN